MLAIKVSLSFHHDDDSRQSDVTGCKYLLQIRYTCKATWKREFKLPWRKASLLISMIEWNRASRLSIKISFYSQSRPGPHLNWGFQHSRVGGSTRGPSWGHPMVVLGTIRSFLEPFCGHLSPKNDKVSEELTLRYSHEGPCVGAILRAESTSLQPSHTRITTSFYAHPTVFREHSQS